MKKISLGIWMAVLGWTSMFYSSKPASAEHFGILLVVRSGDHVGRATMDTSPPAAGFNPRPVVQCHPGDLISIRWSMKDQFPHGALDNVGVHLFIVPENQIGQKTVPDPKSQTTMFDNYFTMQFTPNTVTHGTLRYHAGNPGVYLVRLQSENTAQQFGHEHFAAVDLDVVS